MPGPRIVNTIWPNWVDENGKQAQTGWTLGDQSPVSGGIYDPLLDAATSLTHCGIRNCTIQYKIEAVTTPDTGDFNSVQDQAVFLFKSENYSRLLAIPAPRTEIFIPGSTLVDMSNPAVDNWVQQVFTVLGDTYGSQWLTCAGGRRRRVKIGEV